MPTNAETIEKLARQLERARINSDLQACETLEDFQKIKEKYATLCRDDEKQ